MLAKCQQSASQPDALAVFDTGNIGSSREMLAGECTPRQFMVVFQSFEALSKPEI
jgi:hypothetical protein